MSTSLSQAANLDDEPVPMDSASSLDKIVTAENVSEHRGRGAGFSGSTFNRQSTPLATISALLPPLPISPPRTQKRSHSTSPPLTPPSGPSAQFSTPVGPSPSQSSRKTPSHPNDSPALLSPFRGQGDRSGPTGSTRSPVGRPTTPKPNPWHPLLQSQSGRSTDEPQVEQSPSRWHRQSFARGGGSSDDDGEDRLVEGMEHSLILVPHESEEEFMSNVHRIVPDGEVGTPSPEERTPSPVIPGMEGVESTGKGKGVNNLAGGSRAGPSSMSSYPATPRRPETRPARVGAASHTPIIPQRRERADRGEAPARVRITRARDAKEAEEAIALVDAFEAQTSVKSKGKGKETQGRSNPRGKLAARAEPDNSVMQPSTPPRRQSSLPRPVPAQRHIRNASQTTNSPLPKSLILAEKGVAIAVSPVKGRRLKLLRPTTPPAVVFGSSPPKFEENISPAIRRWLAGPRSPPSPPKPREKKRRFEEEQERSFPPDAFAALGIRIDSVPQLSEKIEAAIQGQERESKKRKRLEAFRDSSSDSSMEDKVKGETQQSEVGREKAVAKSLARPRHVSPLKPAQVDGLGRMAIHPGDLEGAQVIPMSAVESGQTWRKTLFGLDVQEEDESLMSDVTTGGAGLRNLWRHRSQKSDSSAMPNIAFPDDMSLNDARLSQSLPGQAPGWPDLRFPWSMNEAERRTERQRKRSERLAMVESFLTRESDSDSDSDMPATSISGTEEDVASVRGLWSLSHEDSPQGSIGLKPRLAEHFASLFPSAEGSSATESGLLSATPMPVAPSDPADARIALASRRDVRSALYFSVKRREEDEADEGVVDCICGEPDDGRAMVRCDGCKTWSHQVCAGINDENELGECWYCAQCARETASTTHEGSAPTLVQGDASPDRVVERAERRTALFMAPTNEDGRASSPMDIPSSPGLAASPWPFLPKTPRAKESGSTAFLKTSSHPFEPRLHQTPHFFPDPDPLELGSTSASMDLLGTPSRGTKYNVAFVPTSSPRPSSSNSTFRRTLVGPSVFATPKNTSSRKFVGGNNSAETALGSDGGWSVAATLKDQPGLPATPRPHYSMSLQYTDTPIQRSLPRMGNTNQAIATFSAPFDSPIVREGNGPR